MKLSLVVLTPGNKMEGKALAIKLAQFLVGRDPQCHLRPASPLISKRHCVLIQRDGKVFVRDFNSTNGTFINGTPVKGEAELNAGDKLKIGPLLFKVVIEGAASVGEPTPVPPTRGASSKSAKRPKPADATDPEVSTADAMAALPSNGAADTQLMTNPPLPLPDTKELPPPEPARSPSNSADEDVAAMLLALQDEGAPNPGQVPDGSTVHDVTVTSDMLSGNEKKEEPSSSSGGKSDKQSQAKAAVANTAAAAENILKKYMRRSREGG